MSSLLNRSATGENWQLIMLGCADGAKCDERVPGDVDHCGSFMAYPFFISFIFFCSFLVSLALYLHTACAFLCIFINL